MKKIIFVLIFLSLTSCLNLSGTKKSIFFNGTFLKIEKFVQIKVCNPKDPKVCITKPYNSSASSFLVKHNGDKSYIMTSAHVCVTDYGNLTLLPGFEAHEIFYGLTDKLEKHFYQIEAVDRESDLCIVSTKRFKGSVFRIGNIDPQKSERVYNIAAPLGIFDKDLIPIFEGLYVGQAHNRTLVTLPAAGGSSGSPIMNGRGEVIGVVSAVTKNFNQIVISSTLSQIKTIMKTINK
jgi:S1-C subfamily serine protease